MNNIRKQLLIFSLVCLASWGIELLLPIPFPASVIAMIIVIIILLVGAVKAEDLKETASFLQGNMTMFFIPASAKIIECADILKESGIAILLVCVIGMIITFATTGYTVEFIMKLQRKRGDK